MFSEKESSIFLVICVLVGFAASGSERASTCHPNPCNKGTCIEVDFDKHTCICPSDGFSYSNNCEIENCFPHPCKNGGVCIPLSGTNSYQCDCPKGFNGTNCEIDTWQCHPNPCKNGFPCVVKDGEEVCKCQLPYRGEYCEIGPCTDNPCQNGGKCTMYSKVPKCECQSGFYGDRCEKDTCYLRDVCKNGGTCRPYGFNKFMCVCRPHYYGIFCEKEDLNTPGTTDQERLNTTSSTTNLSSSPLTTEFLTKLTYSSITDVYSSHITEISTKSSYSTPRITNTNAPYKTEILTKSTYSTCDCGPHSLSCELNVSGKKICSCETGFSQLNGSCIDCYCGENFVNCFFGNNLEKICRCREGYAQKFGSCKEICKHDVDCQNGGICKITNESAEGFCECHSDYGGDKCEVNNVCKQIEDTCSEYGGVCMIHEGLPQCECPPGKEYVDGVCKKLCDETKCNHGHCEVFGHTYKCRCFVGYTGKHCDEKSSFDERNDLIISIIAIILPMAALTVFGIICWLMFNSIKNKVMNQDPEKVNLI